MSTAINRETKTLLLQINIIYDHNQPEFLFRLFLYVVSCLTRQLDRQGKRFKTPNEHVHFAK